MDWKTYYPRPQLRRASFLPLADGWTLNGHSINVPFPPESKNAQFDGVFQDNLRYVVHFSIPQNFVRAKTILHFGACDQVCTVTLNGTVVGSHEGGYLPFSFDVTALLADENELVVEAHDSGGEYYPYGKQYKKPRGMWYTPVSGIWQSVWLESVFEDYISNVKITPTQTNVTFTVQTTAPKWQVAVSLPDGTVLCRESTADMLTIAIPPEAIRLWCPKDPYLYNVTLSTAEDTVESYFALRTVDIRMVGDTPRICLNGKPIFLNGVLDQGYFAGGIYLPDTPAEYEADIKKMQSLGFHCLRKHIKVEPACFYAACDRLGMLVWQDFVNNGTYRFLTQTALPTIGFKRRRDRVRRLSAGQVFFRTHAKETQAHLWNFPCIIGYTIFNEGWGQVCADDAYRELRAGDPTRLYDATSGWFAQHESDLQSEHIYFRNKVLRATEGRPLFLSECGGYTRTIAGHAADHKTYGYGAAESEATLTERIVAMYREMVLPSIPYGLCGSIYTQLSDVEGERNGLYTYDRQICKVDSFRLRAIADETYATFAAAVES